MRSRVRASSFPPFTIKSRPKGLFFYCQIAERIRGENSLQVVLNLPEFGASERRLESFCQVMKSRRQNSELPFNANEQDSLSWICSSSNLSLVMLSQVLVSVFAIRISFHSIRPQIRSSFPPLKEATLCGFF